MLPIAALLIVLGFETILTESTNATPCNVAKAEGAITSASSPQIPLAQH